ncbi:putative integrase [Shigella flexneri K-315]|uniref:Putative integrase n=1 Tax=Shigella flexneri K-315 TaxID=766150 RepID=I6CS04_SHIFL|nr:putative integrase [Shigella flexneri K-315]
MPCFTAMRAEIALMSGSAFAVTHHAFSSGAGRTSDGNGSHASTLKSPSYTKSVSWQHYPFCCVSFITDAQLFYRFVSSKIVNPIKTTIIGS